MSFCLRPNVCKKCGKPLTLFEGWTCLECEKAEQEPSVNDVLEQIRAEIEEGLTDYIIGEQDTPTAKKMFKVMNKAFDIIDKYT